MLLKKKFNPLLQKRFLFDFIRKKNYFFKKLFHIFFSLLKRRFYTKVVFSNFFLKKVFNFILKNGFSFY